MDTIRATRAPQRNNLQSILLPCARRALLAGLMAASLAVPALAGSVSYAYDTLGRLQSATYSNGVVITYSYDAAGNRSSQVTTGAP